MARGCKNLLNNNIINAFKDFRQDINPLKLVIKIVQLFSKRIPQTKWFQKNYI